VPLGVWEGVTGLATTASASDAVGLGAPEVVGVVEVVGVRGGVDATISKVTTNSPTNLHNEFANFATQLHRGEMVSQQPLNPYQIT